MCSALTSSVSPKLLHGFARSLAPVAFLRNITLLSINMKVIWRASWLKNCEQADQCNNSGETEEVVDSSRNAILRIALPCTFIFTHPCPLNEFSRLTRVPGLPEARIQP